MVPPHKKIGALSLKEVQQLTNINEIEHLLKEAQQQEKELELQMEESIKNDKHILETKLELLEILPTKLKPIYQQIHTLSNKIEETCDLAENVSKKVRLLDNTRHRLQQTQQRLEDIIRVRDCIEGIDGAMKNEEWERACDYIKTYLTIVTQENLESENHAKFQSKGAQNASNQINQIEQSPRKKNAGKVLEETSENLLQQKLVELRSIIQEKADKADSEEEVKRFCKLFTPLGIPQVGLQRYISFVRNSLKQDAEKIHIALRKSIEGRNVKEEEYITSIEAITKLYETVAEYAESKGEIVKESFGPQSVIFLLRNLQQECDVHSTRILQKFQEFFRIPTIVMEISNYSKRAPKFGGGEIQKKDPSELGELLDAIALVSQRTELFERFLRKKAKSVEEQPAASSSSSSDHPHHPSDQSANQPQLGLLHVSETNRKIQEILDNYIILEQYFMVENVHKAIKIDQENSYQQKNNKYQSQLVDYVFFILQKSLFRSLSTYSQQSICAIINFVNQCYSLHLKEELNNLMQSIPGSSGHPRNPDPTANYMMALNAFYQSSENMIKMKVETENEVNHIFALYPSSKQLICACTIEFQETSKEYKSILKQNLELLVNSVQPKLKSAIDLFRAANFELNEQQFAENEINDPFAFKFLEDVQAIFQSFSTQLIKENYETLIQICLHSITIQLEKTLLQKKFTQLGGIQFDKDLRLIVNYFSNHTQRAVRGEFARLMQMASLLNLEKVSEVLDYWGENSGQMTWRLTPSEVRRTLSRRVDFSGEDIANLKL